MAPTDLQVRLAAALATVRDQNAFLDLLRDVLEWPLPDGAAAIADVAYEWPLADLRAEKLHDKLAQSHVYQLGGLAKDQPWGIFLVEFADAQPFDRDRGLTGPLRRLLAGLVEKQRRAAHLPAWKREHLLFICTYKYKHFRIAYFRAPKDGQRQPTLAAFGWGPDIPARTAITHNLDKLVWPEDSAEAAAWVKSWTQSFNVEKVTDRFFDDYVELFRRNETMVATATGYEGALCRLYTQVLMNRLIFLRFVERKGWLKWQGDDQYLQALWTDYNATRTAKSNFYRDRLTPLFFRALALPDDHPDRAPADVVGHIPFINGGLFDHHVHEGRDLDAFRGGTLPDGIFASLLDPEDGLFYRYNFTVMESTPLAIEVAVDPEILGRVFEELITSRHETGSYYTPRPIVSFMCKEALKGFLARRTDVPADALARLVDHHDDAGLTDRMAQVPALLDALAAVRAVDPACGSGAYLLGLLHELIDLYRLLYQAQGEAGESTYKLKLQIISQSLYGVDLDPVATNIAMLRLWLSLAVEAPRPLPLPNLDFKIETGNAVLGPNPEQTESVFLYAPARDLAARKKRYLTAHGEEKALIGAEIREQERALAAQIESLYGTGVIDWRVQFAEVMLSEAGGFDIVLANPPYERQKLISDSGQGPALKKVYVELYDGKADLYVYFYFRGLELLANGGTLAYISSNKWHKADYGKKMRGVLPARNNVQSVIDFGDLPVFKNADAYPQIVIIEKGGKTLKTVWTEVPSLEPPYPDVNSLRKKYGVEVELSSLGDGAWGLPINRVGNTSRKTMPLAEYVSTGWAYGVKTGCKAAFELSDSEAKRLIAEDSKLRDVITPMATGKTVRRWACAIPKSHLVYTPWGFKLGSYPVLRKHLLNHAEKLKSRPECIKGRHDWWCLSRYNPGSVEEFRGPKIVYQIFQVSPCFALDESGQYLNNSLYYIAGRDLYLLGVLNSDSFWREVRAQCSPIRNGYQLMKSYLERCRVPVASPKEKAAVVSLVQKCLDAKGVGCEAWEAEINERVAALYGL